MENLKNKTKKNKRCFLLLQFAFFIMLALFSFSDAKADYPATKNTTGGVKFDVPVCTSTYFPIAEDGGGMVCNQTDYASSAPFSGSVQICSQIVFAIAESGGTQCGATAYAASNNSLGGLAQVCTDFAALSGQTDGDGNRMSCGQFNWLAPSAGTYGQTTTYSCPYGGTLSGTTCITPVLIDNAAFVSYANLPTTVNSGQPFTVSITMQNNGDTTWTSGASYKLVSQNPSYGDVWGMSRINLPHDVLPGTSITFTQTFIAPSAPDNHPYNFQWQMSVDVPGGKWFGSITPNQQITVMGTGPTSVCGNGIKEASEQCDLGTGNGSCPSSCSTGCTFNNCPPAPVCGNGIQEAGEQCDDGANNGTCPETCSSACKINSCSVSSGNWKEVAP